MCQMKKRLRKNIKFNILRKKLRVLFNIENGILTEDEKISLFKDINTILKDLAKLEIKKQTTIMCFNNYSNKILDK